MDLKRTESELLLGNMLLRQQFMVLKRQAKRPALTWRDRTLFVLLASRLRTWKQVLVIVQPETVLRWHRDLFRWVWRRKSRPRRPGKPPLTDDVVSRIRRMAQKNRTWGTERIRGELLKLGLRVSNCGKRRHMSKDRASRSGTMTASIVLPFARVAAGSGIEVLRTASAAPKANAICERFLGSVRRECLDRFLILSERHLYPLMKHIKRTATMRAIIRG